MERGATERRRLTHRSLWWLSLQLGLGLAWVALLASRSPRPGKVGVMLLLAGWLPSVALACWQVRHRRWRDLMLSDLLSAGVLVLLASSAYVPLVFFMVAWFVPLAALPRGTLAELLTRLLSRQQNLIA